MHTYIIVVFWWYIASYDLCRVRAQLNLSPTTCKLIQGRVSGTICALLRTPLSLGQIPCCAVMDPSWGRGRGWRAKLRYIHHHGCSVCWRCSIRWLSSLSFTTASSAATGSIQVNSLISLVDRRHAHDKNYHTYVQAVTQTDRQADHGPGAFHFCHQPQWSLSESNLDHVCLDT